MHPNILSFGNYQASTKQLQDNKKLYNVLAVLCNLLLLIAVAWNPSRSLPVEGKN